MLVTLRILYCSTLVDKKCTEGNCGRRNTRGPRQNEWQQVSGGSQMLDMKDWVSWKCITFTGIAKLNRRLYCPPWFKVIQRFLGWVHHRANTKGKALVFPPCHYISMCRHCGHVWKNDARAKQWPSELCPCNYLKHSCRFKCIDLDRRQSKSQCA